MQNPISYCDLSNLIIWKSLFFFFSLKGVAQHNMLRSASCIFALICLFAVLEVGKILLREQAGQKP